MPDGLQHPELPQHRGPAGGPGRKTIWDRAFAPVDIAFLVYFRIVLGTLFLANVLFYYEIDAVHTRYILPRFHFTYHGFEWVRLWPGNGIHWHLGGLGLLAACIAVGFCYRISACLFALGLTHFFLIDKAYFQNHYYLLCLLAGIMAVLPAHRAFSVDAWRRPQIRLVTVPAWMLWLLRFQLGVPYVFGGIAKLNRDWLAGEPMRSILAERTSYPFIGRFFTEEWCVQLFVQGGLWFDLLVVPALLWRRTRAAAYLAAVVFHVLNHTLFLIGVFPWFMIFATAVYFPPDWPRRLLRRPRADVRAGNCHLTWAGVSRTAKAGALLLAGWCTFHIAWPLRHLAYSGDPSWTEQGQLFAWRMMLRDKRSFLRFHLTHLQTGLRGSLDPLDYITPFQLAMMSNDAGMIQEFSRFIADEFLQRGHGDVEVRALVLTSLNGRKPQLFIDPHVNLAAEPRTFRQPHWIMPLTEPLRKDPWSVPMSEWPRHVDLPPLPSVDRPSSAASAPSNEVELESDSSH
ncbi:MAG: HTTM domain-containing protein [Planctomycetaceae bacterium]